MTSICFRSMFNKTIIRYCFRDTLNNQGQRKPSVDNPYLDLDDSGYL